MKILFTILLAFSASVFYSQAKFDFEAEYEKATILSHKNLDSSETVLNSIIAQAKEGKELEYAGRAYNMKAYLYQLRLDEQKCQEFANQSYELSEKINYTYGKALSLRTLALQSARLGMKDDALQKFEMAVEQLKDKADDTSQEGYKVRGNVYAAYMGLLTPESRNYKEQDYYIRKTIENYEKINDGKLKNALLTNFYQSLAVEYSNQKKFATSQKWLKKALSILSANDITGKMTDFYISAVNYKELNKQDSALYYCKKTLELARKYKFKEYELLIIEQLPKLYAILKDSTNHQQAFSLLKTNDSIKKIAVNTISVNKENSFKAKEEKQKSSFNIVLCSAIGALVLLGIFIAYHFRQRKKYQQIVKQIYTENELRKKESAETKDENSEKQLPDFTTVPFDEPDTETSSENLKISPEIEERILKSLDKFEQKLKFNEKGVSLYNLADSFNVNTKYLSAIIKKHRGLPFNKYISRLRINYIVDQLLNEPKFLKYKIRHLAELTGFSSHSAFSSEFKDLMGMHPSVFIKELKSVKE